MVNFESLLAKIEKLSINIFSNININIHRGPKIKNANFISAADLADPKKRKELEKYGDIVGEYIRDGGTYMLPSGKSVEEIEDVGKTYKKEADVLKFIKEKLPPEDIPIWTTALVVRRYHREKNTQRVWEIKGDMLALHGKKGANIANLCTGGYLETEIMPRYEKFVVEMDNREKFLEEYKSIVMDYLFAVFVRDGDKVDGIVKEIESKIEQLLTSRRARVDVQGIGFRAVETVQKAVEVVNKKHSDKIKDIQTESTREIIKSKIFLVLPEQPKEK